MEKVKLTQEQADDVEELIEAHICGELKIDEIHETLITEKLEGGWGGVADDISNVVFIDALRIGYEVELGYEVEPEFKVGDWVIDEEYGFIGQITKIESDGIWAYWDDDNKEMRIRKEDLRHATTEEIERQWWKKNNRDVWELKEKDVVIDRFNRIREIHEDDGDTVSYFDGLTSSKEYVKETCRVVCFAEDRKDV